MCITYSVLSCKLATSFSNFSIFIFSGKMVNQYEICVIFEDIEHQPQENILYYFLHYNFLCSFHKVEKYHQSFQNYLLEAFAILLNHINYLHPNI